MTDTEFCYDRMRRTSAEFLMHGLRELGLNDGSLTLDDLMPVAEKIKQEHDLVAGDWKTLEEYIDLINQLDFIEAQAEFRRDAQEMKNRRAKLIEAVVLAPELAESDGDDFDWFFEG